MSQPASMERIPIAALATLFAMLLLPLSHAVERTDQPPLFTMDENVWATFYDLPSRRFRSTRDAFIRKDFEAAAADLQVGIGFLTVEADRTVAELQAPLAETIANLERIRAEIRDTSVSIGDLDVAFARTHWLLAQHYLVFALLSREASQHTAAGRYLWATAHHLERAVLWSDARIDRSLVRALDSTREMGFALQTSDRPERVYRDRPIVATATTIVKIGKHLDRKVWIDERVSPNRQ